jgi:hypothetical protein
MDSWLEVLHERERITNADESVLMALRELLAEPPHVTFSIATDRPVARQSGWEGSDNQDGHFGGRGDVIIVAAQR